MIDVKLVNDTNSSDGDPLRFAVHIRQGGQETHHDVTIARADYQRLAGGASPQDLVDAAFRFLLDREPPRSILSRFDVSVIARYFPEFERTLPRYLENTTK
jgi:hypothetical protein